MHILAHRKRSEILLEVTAVRIVSSVVINK